LRAFGRLHLRQGASRAKPAPSEGIVAAGVENDEVEPPASALHLAEHKRGIEHLKIDNAHAPGRRWRQSYRMYPGSR
jgi:hypothetical protein